MQEKTLPVGSQDYSGIVEKAINKKHALLIFTEMVLNDFKTQLQQIQVAGVMYPMVANIEMRPCLISVARRRLKSSTLPSAVKPAGSQKPTGACTPSSFSNARKGDAV